MKENVLKFLKIISAPIMENGQFSVGRTLLVVTFVLAVIKWKANVEIVQTHLMILMSLLGYVLGTKGIEAVKDIASKYTEMKKVTK